MSLDLKKAFWERVIEVSGELASPQMRELEDVSRMLEGTTYSYTDAFLLAQVTRGVSPKVSVVVEQALHAMNCLGSKSLLEAFREENPEAWVMLSPAQKTGEEPLPDQLGEKNPTKYPTPKSAIEALGR